MKLWAVEYLINPSRRRSRWHLDLRTLRRRKFEAKEAPLQLDQSEKHWDEYHARLRAGTARIVKVTLEKVPCAQ